MKSMKNPHYITLSLPSQYIQPIFRIRNQRSSPDPKILVVGIQYIQTQKTNNNKKDAV